MAKKGENIRIRKDGRWEGRYTLVLYDGSKKIVSVYGKSYEETKEKLALKKGTLSDVSITTFGDIAENWLRYIHDKRKYSTYIKYKTSYENHLNILSDVPIENMTAKVLKKRLSNLEMYASESLKASVYSLLNRILKWGNKEYEMNIKLYAWETEMKKKKIVETFNHSEQVKLFHYLYCDTDVTKAGIILCLSTGLRLGEICALKWSDIDFFSKVLHVNATVQRIVSEGKEKKTILYESVPKSEYSIREIPLSDEMMALLKTFPEAGKYVLSGNKPMEPRTYQNKLKHYLMEAGISHKNFHALRHTFATNCIESGMDIKSLSEILGHADVHITLNRYVHPSFETKRKHMNNLSTVYRQFKG